MARQRSTFGKPSEEARAILIDAVHCIEDMFVSYANDTVTRVIDDIELQKVERETLSGQSSARHSAQQSPTVSELSRQRASKLRVFEIKHTLAISSSLLINDI